MGNKTSAAGVHANVILLGIDGAGKSANGAFLIYQESSLVIRAIRDYFSPDIGEVLIDTDEIYDQAKLRGNALRDQPNDSKHDNANRKTGNGGMGVGAAMRRT